jgi:N-acetylglutamate synthase-like GNAT family acetyltransferase
VSYAQNLADVRIREARGGQLDRAEIDRRFSDLRGATFEDVDVFHAFADLFNAVCAPQHITFVPCRQNCALDVDDRQIRIHGILRSAAGDTIGEIQRHLDFRRDLAVHQKLIVNPAFRTVGIGAILLAHSLRFYEAAGISDVHLKAGLSTGPYYWAKLGFEFADAGESAAIQHWFARVNAKLALGLDCRAARSPSEWVLLGDEPKTQCSLGQIASAFPDVANRIETRANDNAIDLTTPIRAGKAVLLAGPDWRGRLTVSRASQTRVLVYVAARAARAEALLCGGRRATPSDPPRRA